MFRLSRIARTGLSLTLGVALIVAACTDDSSEGTGTEIASPGSVDAELTDDRDNARLTLTFPPVPDADGYLLQLDGHDQPIRLDTDDCADEECRIVLDRLTAAGAPSATVAAFRGDEISEPSEEVELPDWPKTQPPKPISPDEPIEIAVTRIGPDGRPTVTTETLPRAGDVQERIAALEAEEDVVSAGVATPLTPAGETDAHDNPFPAGIATWQQEALDFDSLPEDPRGQGVVVAVLDDGITANHPNIDEADITEINVVQPGRDAPGDHATSVASMIVGEHTGLVPGIALGTTLHVYDVHNEDGDLRGGTSDDLARGIYQAVDDGADIINISQTASCVEIAGVELHCPDDTLAPAIDYAEQNDVVVVAAAGNDGDGAAHCAGTNLDSWPAAFPSVITVGGTARDGSRWPCTPDKDYIDVLAPAANLRTAVDPDGYAIASGTSLAAPLVSGLLAAILAELPDLSPAEIRDALALSTVENGRLLTGLLLQNLGLEPAGEPVIDMSTAVELWPYSVGFYFPEGTRVWDEAAAATLPDPADLDRLDNSYPWSGDGSFDWFFDDTFPVLVGGLIAVDEDGKITGFGTMRFDQHGSPRYVTCPETPANPGMDRRRFTYTWDVPVLVTGEAATDERTGNRYAELTFSFGDDATADEAGTLPDLLILKDDFEDCATDIRAADTLFTDPRYPWSEVKTWPERHIALHENVIERVIAASPLALDEVFFPNPEDYASPGEGTGAHVSGGTIGDVSFRTQIGAIDFYQLDPN